YQLRVRDLANRGGERMAYRFTIEPIEPDFSLALGTDSFVVEKGKPLEISVNVAVRDGLREPIEIRVVGLPLGVSAEPVKFEATGDSPMATPTGGRRGKKGGEGPSGQAVKVILKADASAKAGGAPFRIEGRTSSSRALVKSARFPLNLPLAGQHYAAWLTV